MKSLGFDPKALVNRYAEQNPDWNKPVSKERASRKPLPLDHPNYGKTRWATLSPGEKGFAFINGKIEEVYVYSRQVTNGTKMVEVSPCLRVGESYLVPLKNYSRRRLERIAR